MIIYSVQCRVQSESAEAWERYFLDTHLDDVLNTGCFTSYVFKKEISDEANEMLFIADYYSPSQESLDTYNREFAAALKQDVMDHFSGKFTAQRQIFQLIGASTS